ITIGTAGLRITTDIQYDNGQPLPAVATAAMKNACPVAIDTNGPGPNGQPRVIPAAGDAGRGGYYGFSLFPKAANKACTVLKGVVVRGFAGVEPGKPVFVADGPYPASPAATYSGLTHTQPATGLVMRIGVGVDDDGIRFD
ncbi:MAG TPA: hypothetical protein VK324_05585, partial [Tepidisphaeraceae bacterium]|nr:hypothetical protein [Tepidisphaeraceae bacterium]